MNAVRHFKNNFFTLVFLEACDYDPDDDDPPPCNNGTCIYDGYNKKKCRCPDINYGDKCESKFAIKL